MPDSTYRPDVTAWPNFGWERAAKDAALLAEMRRLTNWHRSACPPYRAIIEKLGFADAGIERLEDVPFLPVRLFKHLTLRSVPEDAIVKTMTSSGTSGQNPSRIYLDKVTAGLQVKVLARIVTEFIGPKRLPMLVVDCKATASDRYRFSARAAGILGFSMFGSDIEYALDDDMSPNMSRIQAFLEKHAGTDILVFGFTLIVWRNLVLALEEAGETVGLQTGILVHGGGWKQLLAQAVMPEEYRARIARATGITRIHNYYGMVEQTGSILMECEAGRLHAPAWSDVLIRAPVDFSPLPAGQPGLIQLLSVIPHSYPGHALLSEDIGEMIGVDDCPCGRMGKTVKIHGRLEQAEIRGCSDTLTD